MKQEHMTEKQFDALKKIRGDWGEVRPYTRVFEDERKKAENRKHYKYSHTSYDEEIDYDPDDYETYDYE